MILPSIINVSETALRAVPKEYEEASLALGAAEMETCLLYTSEDRHKHGLVLDYPLEDNMVLQRYFEPEFTDKAGFLRRKKMCIRDRRGRVTGVIPSACNGRREWPRSARGPARRVVPQSVF